MNSSDFENQLNNSLIKTLSDFNSDSNLKNVRNVYRENFNVITSLMSSRNDRSLIEDIINFDIDNSKAIMNNFILLKEINRGIRSGIIKVESIL